MKLPAFDYAAPATLAEALALLAADGEARPLAGGQSLVPMMTYLNFLVDPTFFVFILSRK